MNTKKILVISLFTILSLNLSAQLKVFSSGYVGINGATPVGYPLGVKSYYGQDIQIDPSLSSSRIASSTDNIHFYYNASLGYNKVYAQSFSIGSDSTLKTNIESLSSGALFKILKMRPVSYIFKEDQGLLNNNIYKKIGLIAQELEEILPEVISYSEVAEIKMIDYDMLIPVLIKAIQEQQDDINDLHSEIETLKSGSINKRDEEYKSYSTDNKCNNKSVLNQDNFDLEGAILYQNAPNPFSERTEIRYNIPNDASSAHLYVFNLQGKLIETLLINNFGNGFIQINGYQYDPGMYLYTLIVNGQEIDTKRMILTN